MSKLLYLQASPRKTRSWSIRVADALAEAYRQLHGPASVETVNLFDAPLPELNEQMLANKYAVLHGQEVTAAQRDAWRAVELVIEQFTKAERYLLAVPMWNFGIPYRLKHWLDVVIQPGYTFQVTETGYQGLLDGRPAVVVYSSGGDYSEAPAADYDMQKPYLELTLGFMGVDVVDRLVIAPTLASGEQAEQTAAKLADQARELAGRL
ncbi:MAG: FMN-dependent NADH-azoreductase [Phycisphaerae bacterium]